MEPTGGAGGEPRKLTAGCGLAMPWCVRAHPAENTDQLATEVLLPQMPNALDPGASKRCLG